MPFLTQGGQGDPCRGKGPPSRRLRGKSRGTGGSCTARDLLCETSQGGPLASTGLHSLGSPRVVAAHSGCRTRPASRLATCGQHNLGVSIPQSSLPWIRWDDKGPALMLVCSNHTGNAPPGPRQRTPGLGPTTPHTLPFQPAPLSALFTGLGPECLKLPCRKHSCP